MRCDLSASLFELMQILASKGLGQGLTVLEGTMVDDETRAVVVIIIIKILQRIGQGTVPRDGD